MNQVNSEVLDTIETHIQSNKSASIEFLQRLVQIDSTPGNEGMVQEVIADELATLGLVVEELPVDGATVVERGPAGMEFHPVGGPNVLGTMSGESDGRSLLLTAHCDTVPLGHLDDWSSPPLGGEIKAGYLWGRGSCDTKAGIASAIYAMRAIRDAGIQLAGDVCFLSTVGEETGNSGAIAFSALGRTFDGAIVGEPTELNVVAAHAGSARASVHIKGLGSHASVRDNGVSALEKVALLLGAMRELESLRNSRLNDPLYDHVQNVVPINIGKTRAGDWASTVPEDAYCEIRVGVLHSEDFQTVQREFEEFIETWAAGDPWLRDHPPTVDWSGPQVPGSSTQVDSELVQALFSSAQKHVEGSRIQGATYGADMVHFVDSGIPSAIFGPGSIDHAHRVNERVPLVEVDRSTSILGSMISTWSG